MTRIIFLLLLLPILCEGQGDVHRYKYEAMGTQWLFIVKGGTSHELAVKAAYEEVKRIEKIFSHYDSQSEASMLNVTSGWMKISSEMQELISHAEKLRCLSGGAFDIRIGGSIKRWKDDMEVGNIPSSQSVSLMNSKDLRLEVDRQRVLTNENTLLDFGGIAKGYAVDKAYEVLLNHGYDTILIDGGGDIRMGYSPDGKGWKIQQYYEDDQLLRLENIAIATSGPNYQNLRLNNVEYSHILDPASHESITNERGVVVSAPTCMMADALATTFSINDSFTDLQPYYDFKVNIKEKGEWVEKQF